MVLYEVQSITFLFFISKFKVQLLGQRIYYESVITHVHKQNKFLKTFELVVDKLKFKLKLN